MMTLGHNLRQLTGRLATQVHRQRSPTLCCTHRGFAESKDGKETTEVCFVDPRLVLQGGQGDQALEDLSNQGHVSILKVPSSFVPQLSQGHLELGDMDDPLNQYVFGKQAEIFQYSLIGQHRTQSGFTSIIQRDVLERIISSSSSSSAGGPSLASWAEFSELMQGDGISQWPHPRLPFLFAGRVIESPMAAVYQLVEQGKLTGLVISSEAAGGDDDE